MTTKETSDNLSARRSLAIYVRRGGIDALVYDAERHECSSVEVDPAVVSPSKVLEEAVYQTPWLLGDFSRIDVVASADRFMTVPQALEAGDQGARAVAALVWPDAGHDCLSLYGCGASAKLLSVFDRQLYGFVNRTFTGASLRHRLASLADFFSSLSRPVNRVKLYACFTGDNSLDVIAMTADTLLMANTFGCQGVDDELYFIMVSVRDCGFDALDDEVIVCGDPGRCEAAMERLRVYLNSVMPLLLPQDYTDIPLELIRFVR